MVGRQSAAGHDAMQVRVMLEVLSPTVEHGEETDLRAQMPRIGGDGAQGLCGSVEENVVDHGFVLVSDGGNLLRNGKDDVEVRAVEKLGLALLDPLGPCQGLALGALPVAAGYGEISITSLMGSDSLWGVPGEACSAGA